MSPVVPALPAQALLAVTLLGAALLGCSRGEPVQVDHDARRAELREGLKTSLGASYDAPVEGLAAADVEQGKSVYQRSCSGCHGEKADGKGHRAAAIDPPPANLVDGRGRDFYSDAGQLHLIREGVTMTAMPPFGRSLKDEDIVAAYAYVVSLRQ